MAAVAALLIVVAIVATGFAFQYGLVASKEERLRTEAQKRAEAEGKAKQKLEASLYFQSIALAHLELSRDDLGRAREQLDACPTGLRQWEWYYLERLCRLEPVVLKDAVEVNSVDFSSDGELLATAGGSRDIKIRESKTGVVIQTLDAKTEFVHCVVFHPGGKHLAAANADGKVKVWDLTKKEVIFNQPGFIGEHAGTAHIVAFSPDGRQLAMGNGGKVEVWDWRNERLIHSLTEHVPREINLAFSADGRRLASASWSGHVMIWDVETGELLHTLVEHRHPVSALAFSPDGRVLVSASYDRHLIVWNAETGESIRTLRGHNGLVLGVAFIAFSPDGSPLASGDLRLASVGEDRTVRVWEVSTGREVLSLREHADMCLSVAVSPDGRRLATAGRDATVRLWDATPLEGNERQEVLTFPQGGEVWTMAISTDGRVASAGLDTPVKVWEVESGRETLSYQGHPSLIFSVAWHPDRRRIASSGWDLDHRLFVVNVWNSSNGVKHFQLPRGGESFAVAFSPDGRYLVTAGKTLQVWDAQTGELVCLLGTLDQFFIRGLVFSPDGKHLASASSEGTVKFRDATRLEVNQTARLTIRTRAPQVEFIMAFSPDGRRLVAGGEKYTVKIWDVQTGEELHAFAGHKGDVWAAAFSPDPGGRWVASAGEDSTVKLWDSHSGQLVHGFRGHTGLVSSLAFTSDGQLLLSGSRDGTVKMWSLKDLGRGSKAK